MVHEGYTQARHDMRQASWQSACHIPPSLMYSLLMSLVRLVKYSSKVVTAAAPVKQLSILS